MLHSEHSPENNKTLEISTEAIIKNSEMLKFVPNQLKAKTFVKMQLKSYRS